MRVAVIAAQGQVGSEVAAAFTRRGCEVMKITKDQLDVTQVQRVEEVLGRLAPDAVVNASAYMNADRCERHPDQAYAVNTVGARNVAHACAQVGAVCIWFSSDFVFDGTASRPCTEEDNPNPIMTYGMAKLAGEAEVRWGCNRHYVVRTSGVFGKVGLGGRGGNFVENILSRAHAGQPLQVVDDVVASHTYAVDLAEAVVDLTLQEAPYGLYHITNEGYASWYELCRQALVQTGLKADLTPIRLADRPEAIARRPVFTPLRSVRLPESISRHLRPWRDGLNRYLKERGLL